MTSKLDRLRAMTVVVADTGDIDAIRTHRPHDATTNPSLVFRAAQLPQYRDHLAAAVREARADGGTRWQEDAADRLAVRIGTEILALVPGVVSTEVDARLSFDTMATVTRARRLAALYRERGVTRDRFLVKIASTWEGIQAARLLEQEGIRTNLTLMFSLAQAVAAAEAGAWLVSPFVGRILDWHVARSGRAFAAEEDPGVLSVTRIWQYYQRHGHGTIVMGASFRSAAQVEQLAGCDRLTIAPALLAELAADDGELPRRLDAASAPADLPRLPADERAFRWLMNEDAMATEKLAEGIRLFTVDQARLLDLLAQA